MLRRSIIFIALLLILKPVVLNAQPDVPWQIFLDADIDEFGRDRITFVNPFIDDEISVEVLGERYTLLEQEIMFFDVASRQVMLIMADGTLTKHPFIQPGPMTRRVDWIVSPDRKLIAWTLTEGDSQRALTTVTTIANLNGTNPRQVLVDGPRDGIRALPVAFNVDRTQLYMDFQPDAIGALTPFQQYAGLFALDIESGKTTLLPDEPACFCGAMVRGDVFIRLVLSDDLSGFDVRVYDLANDTMMTIDAISLGGFTQAGDMRISPDGQQAVYVLSRLEGFGSEDQSVETALVGVDLQAFTQRVLIQPQPAFLKPVSWTENNSALIFTRSDDGDTWKLDLTDESVERIAAASFLGVFRLADSNG